MFRQTPKFKTQRPWIAKAILKVKREQGYTLIELLVAILIAGIVITPLLGLAMNLLRTDQQEQAKATSEQEIQDAANYIARDLEQAVFIYDNQGLSNAGIQNEIPPNQSVGVCNNADTCKPVLVFWKRKPVKDAIPIDYLNEEDQGSDCTDENNADICDDTFVYSLVAYYLIEDQDNNNVWSNTARIGRFEVSDGVNVGGVLLEDAVEERDDGFAPFECQIGESVADCLRTWNKASTEYSANSLDILIDFVDQSSEDTLLGECPEYDLPEDQRTWSTRIPPNLNNFPTSFYACVKNDSPPYVARFYLRGNALARIRPEDNPPTYSEGRSAYFPEIQTEVSAKGRFVP
ncbi:hormogonium polysaccharide secretion pseudopilin HpsC [Spirulina sp. CS-785/01]|uniref:hormogonium polysaccharide secretion pseudopilin HpsC n=1 Tax=Spirulina sp. CS-785/01 TaxID=3021716 RepID=UPI00232AED53|nr:hormogonium polysaccharide secretion pseudopilin HpsC [Spirulina sp. CS-785/01]MDB9313685.1 hormogonium polysaccharide secretion pseudopilin HpsC [Spirulina sp. CS-785/01]